MKEKLAIIAATLASASALAISAELSIDISVSLGLPIDHPPWPSWHPAGTNDVRGPCPMLNTLANHNILPHNGKSLNSSTIASALDSALNINGTLAATLFAAALSSNPSYPNATTFDLDHIGRHNILEHDGSLSRADYNFGHDANSFNASVFAQTRTYWPSETIYLIDAAKARMARLETSNATNPSFCINTVGHTFTWGDSTNYLLAFAIDREEGTANRTFVEYMFENERLPYELGWSRPTEPITTAVFGAMQTKLQNATGTEPEWRDCSAV